MHARPKPDDAGENVAGLDVSIRFVNRLEEDTGIVTCRDLARVGQRALRLVNLGDKCVNEIAAAFLERYGVELPQHPDLDSLADIEPPFKSKLEAFLHVAKKVGRPKGET